MPTKDMRTCCVDSLRKLQQECDFFFPVHESWITYFKQYCIEYSFSDGDTDYIYTSEKMQTYAGRKLHKKRNLLKQFKENYEATAVEMNNDNLKDAKYILEQWQELSGMTKEETDYHACCEALSLYNDLCVCGGIYYIDEKPVGFILGEELTDNTYVLHFAKGGSLRIKGFISIYTTTSPISSQRDMNSLILSRISERWLSAWQKPATSPPTTVKRNTA